MLKQLSSLFMRPKPEATSSAAIGECVVELIRYVDSIKTHLGKSRFDSETTEKQSLSIYCFGAVSVLAQQKGISPIEAKAIYVAILMKSFAYDQKSSEFKADAIISAVGDKTSFLYPTIHRGIDGFVAWQSRQDDSAAQDFSEIVAHLLKKQSERKK